MQVLVLAAEPATGWALAGYLLLLVVAVSILPLMAYGLYRFGFWFVTFWFHDRHQPTDPDDSAS